MKRRLKAYNMNISIGSHWLGPCRTLIVTNLQADGQSRFFVGYKLPDVLPVYSDRNVKGDEFSIIDVNMKVVGCEG